MPKTRQPTCSEKTSFNLSLKMTSSTATSSSVHREKVEMDWEEMHTRHCTRTCHKNWINTIPPTHPVLSIERR